MDNLGSHKGTLVRRAIRAAGAKLFFLPPYSPDLNPIEQRIGSLLDAFPPHECANYLRNAGYASS